MAARDGDLAAVRGHLRRDRRCLDQLFEAGGGGRFTALHAAAAYDHTAVVAFLLAKGAAVDVRDSDGPGAQSREPQRVPPTPAVLRSDSAALCSTQRPRGERQAAAGREGLGGRQGRRRPGASADVIRCHNRFENSFSPAISTNSCSSMWHLF